MGVNKVKFTFSLSTRGTCVIEVGLLPVVGKSPTLSL